MSSVASFFATACIIVLTVGAAYACGKPEDFLTTKGDRQEFKETLTFRVERGGIAGFTGTITAVEPAGKWRILRFRKDETGKEDADVMKTGELTQAELVGLARQLAKNDVLALPASIGQEAKVNPQRYSITFGKKAVMFSGITTRSGSKLGQALRKAAESANAAESDVIGRFARTVEAIESVVKE